jgi:hypothetical protein
MIGNLTLRLPSADGSLEAYTPGDPSPWPERSDPPRCRIAYAAAHVVADPRANVSPWLEPAVDWDATLAYRRHLWQLGLSIAEAMDTAQRGMGLDWPTSRELIRRSLHEARAMNMLERIACGAGTDHLSSGDIDAVVAAYELQCGFVEQHGGRIILMASRALAACARGPGDYARVYERILSQVQQPVIIHWLGDMFDPALGGYWGSASLDQAMDTCLAIISCMRDKVDGIKVSLLDAEREMEMRRRLPPGVRLYTGDDFNYPTLIESGSDALLGIFDGIAPAAAASLHALDANNKDEYHAIFGPIVPLARHVFASPTRFYKTGLVFLAYLNDHQSHFRMIGGQESARSVLHLAQIFRLADQARLLRDPELAATRIRLVLTLAGISD